MCEKPWSSSSLGNETCETCKGFFRRFSRKLNSSQPPVCNQNCDVNKEKRNNCSSCRYEKCLAVGLSIESVYTDKIRPDETNNAFNCQTKVMKTEVDDDLNLNPSSINEMRNLSIEVVLSSTSSSSSKSFSSSSSSSSSNSLSNSLTSQVSSSSSSPPHISDSFNYSDLVQSLYKEIDYKKSQIRLEIDEHKIKYHLAELSEKISQCLLNSLKQHNSKMTANDFYSELISNRTRSYSNDFNNENKQLLIAYQCLIDNQTNSCAFSNSFELRVKSLLDNIYASINESSLLVSKSDLLKNNKLETSRRSKSMVLTNDDNNKQNSVSNLFDNNNNNIQYTNQIVEYESPVNSYETYYNNSQCYNFGITLTSNYSNLTAEEIQSNTLKLQSLKKNQNGLAELKIWHFLLLLFSSFQNLDEFIKTGMNVKNGDNKKSNESINNLNDCQKFIIKLIDRLCDDKSVKTKILLSVSEIDFF